MSAGNAHPYSWSSIINGRFDGNEITKVGYPAVTKYLEVNADTIGISGARVTHVWTQDKAISESIAQTAGITHLVSNLEDMIPEVDAVILARDDPEQHVAMSRPFIDADIPLFIDKPLAITREDLLWFSQKSASGKFIMSCSSMRYSVQCRAVKTEMEALGELEFASAVGKKDWIKYGIHILEGLFALLDDPEPASVKHIGKSGKDMVHIEFKNGFQAVIHLFMDIAPTSQISLFGQKGWRLIEIKNPYAMFRDTIIEFVKSVEEGTPRISFDKTSRLISTLIAAKESLEQGGKTIFV